MRYLPPLLIEVQGVRLLREIAVDLRPRKAEEAQAPPRGKRTPGTEITRESNRTHINFRTDLFFKNSTERSMHFIKSRDYANMN
ncbi:hypothetical protein JOC95_003738 [Bacillus tianshenii]|uniref:Uncharacterized protein n=1 Tax=Sutcliffiella tianshenii TaxID=1463404 RepID=A0ABS2P5Z4_9BACI|nr:hypothetical protein [Bacillus tianshenii]